MVYFQADVIQTPFAPIVHPKMNSGKESVADAEFGFLPPPLALRRWSAEQKPGTEANSDKSRAGEVNEGFLPLCFLRYLL
jgi:hypothetical protein